MCGFAGFIAYGATGLDTQQRRHILESMGRALAHRGPDDHQFYDDGVLSLVFRRLTIVGTAEDRQPIFSENQQHLLVCNGEIYNHTELRRTLSTRHHFATQSDCEVLLHAYADSGPKALDSIRGMFAAAIWDRQNHRLFLARDRLGIKPLYICELPSGLLFGSELKALLEHPQCPRQTDWSSLNADPLSLTSTPSYVRGVEYLAGGSFLLAERNRRPVVKKYWRLEDHIATDPFGGDAGAYRAAYDHLLQDATLEHLQGQGPVGIHLSGGLDSALLTAIVGRQKHDAMCFTVVERTTYQVGDVQAAQKIARDFGLAWHPILFNYKSLLDTMGFGLKTLEQSVWAMDSPLFDIEWMIKTELNRKIRTQQPHLKILLLGQGADEFAGGYSKRIDRPYQSWAQYLSDEVVPSIGTYLRSPDSHPGHHSVFSGLHPQPAHPAPFHQWMRLMVRQLQHHNLWHEDRTSAMFGMEARVPFLDHRIVELLASVPAHLHAELFWNKQIVRDCMKARAPNYDLTRQKVGFCWTNDARSVEMIIHSMACMVSKDFQEQYVEAPNFPFDRDETMAMVRKVVGREPGFFVESLALLSRITSTIFHSLHTDAAALAYQPDLQAQRVPSQLVVVRESQWSGLQSQLEAEPLMPFAWQSEHCISLPVGARIRISDVAVADTKCALVVGEDTMAEISYPKAAAWINRFFDAIQRPAFASRTVAQWSADLGVGMQPLTEFLSALLQCGFITTPVVAEKSSAVHSHPIERASLQHALVPRPTPAPRAKATMRKQALARSASKLMIGGFLVLTWIANGID